MDADVIKTIRLDLLKPLLMHFTLIGNEEEQIIMNDMLEGKMDSIDPILVRRMSPAEIEAARQKYPGAIFEIVDGHTRYKLAKKLGWTEIKARVIECTLDEALIMNYRKNKARGAIDPLRTAMLINYLTRKGYQPSRIAASLSLPEPEILELLETAKVAPEALKKIMAYTERERKIISKEVLIKLLRADKDGQMKLAEAIIKSSSTEAIMEKTSSKRLCFKSGMRGWRFGDVQSREVDDSTMLECPGCGARLKIFWSERRVEWI